MVKYIFELGFEEIANTSKCVELLKNFIMNNGEGILKDSLAAVLGYDGRNKSSFIFRLQDSIVLKKTDDEKAINFFKNKYENFFPTKIKKSIKFAYLISTCDLDKLCRIIDSGGNESIHNIICSL
jgi:hypothetical protein